MKLIRKQSAGSEAITRRGVGGIGLFSTPMDRRAFLRRSGLTAGAAALAAALPPAMMRRAKAAEHSKHAPKPGVETVIRRSVCTHCSVGCGVIAEVQNGVWTGQEPDFDSPFNLGAHCAKGASIREHGIGEKRIKYPMKLTGGKWKRLSWDQAVNEIGDKMLNIREKHGPDATWFCGSSKASNEGSYLQRKFVAFWGTNNIDHQARICHSTTVSGVANTWGYGAMTNSLNDLNNSGAVIFIGSNAAEAHPVGMQHILHAKENGTKIIVCDPRFTRTAAHADHYVRFRPGSDVALVWGMLWHVFDNGWEDRDFIDKRVYAMDMVRDEVKQWTPELTEKVTGVPRETLYEAARLMAENRPSSLVWCMGGTQHHIGNNNTRAYCIFQLALGNLGVAGGGANIFRGHDNVQGATDIGPQAHSLPAYYGLSEGAWKHWARVWEVPYDWFVGRFDMRKKYTTDDGTKAYTMNTPGVPVSRWIDGVLEDPAQFQQASNFKAIFFQGHASNSQTRGGDMKKACEKLEMIVISDPYPTHLAVLGDRQDGVYLLPTATQLEQAGSVTATNRALQWRETLIEPLFESKPDAAVLYLFAQKFGFADKMFKNIAIDENGMPSPEDTLREINRGSFSIGYTGQSPERLKLHAKHRGTFDVVSTKAIGGPVSGDYYGLPWPCWGTAEIKHPGTPLLYDTHKPVAEGGLCFRARFGVERNGVNLLAENSYPVGSEIKDGYPEFTYAMLRQLGWEKDLTEAEMKVIREVAGVQAAKGPGEGDKPNDPAADAEEQLAHGSDQLHLVSWKTDISGGIQRVAIKHGCAPYGNAKARCEVWTFPDPIPVHREPLYTPRRDLLPRFRTVDDRKAFYRLPTRYWSIQKENHAEKYPLILSSGRLVEYEGGGAETRSNSWLAELQQDMFVEINPADANDRGLRDGQWVWLEGAEGVRLKLRTMVTQRVGRGVVWSPFHFGGWFEGKDLIDRYPEGTAPYVRGEAINSAMTYGYDTVTQMQETKVTLCQITAA